MSMKTFARLMIVLAGVLWSFGEWLCFGQLAAAIAGIGYALGCLCTAVVLDVTKGEPEVDDAQL